ncbi:MAG: hypothetical protein ACOC8N_02605 [Spirochaetota bacterium]
MIGQDLLHAALTGRCQGEERALEALRRDEENSVPFPSSSTSYKPGNRRMYLLENPVE